MSQTLSELEKLETYYAPCMTKAQSEKRCLALQAKIYFIREFIDIADKLDPAMRITLLNYLETPSTSSAYTNNIDINSEYEYLEDLIEDQTEDNTDGRTELSKTLSPKRKKNRKKRIIS